MTKPLCILTGASSGIGLSIYKKMIQQGYPVISISRRPPAALSSSSSIPTSATFHISFDLEKIEKIQELESKVRGIESSLNISTSILVNCAGISNDHLLISTSIRLSNNLINSISLDTPEIQSTLNLNLLAPILLSRMVLKPMIRKKHGQIINISSIIGPVQGNPGQSIYAASKSGLVGFTKSLAKEVARWNIKVNSISPGFISTEMTEKIGTEKRKEFLDIIPLQKFGEPDQVADLVMFLISTSHYMTGSNIIVDGGLTA